MVDYDLQDSLSMPPLINRGLIGAKLLKHPQLCHLCILYQVELISGSRTLQRPPEIGSGHLIRHILHELVPFDLPIPIDIYLLEQVDRPIQQIQSLKYCVGGEVAYNVDKIVDRNATLVFFWKTTPYNLEL